MFEDLSTTLDERLPKNLERLRETEKRLLQCFSKTSSQLKEDVCEKVKELESRHLNLLGRRNAIENRSREATAQLRGFTDLTEVLTNVIEQCEAKLPALRSGPKFPTKPIRIEMEQTAIWYSGCEELVNLINSCEEESTNLAALLSHPELKPPAGCAEKHEKYLTLRNEVNELFTCAKVFNADVVFFVEGVQELEHYLQSIKSPIEGKGEEIHLGLSSSSIDLSKRAKDIEIQFQMEAKTKVILDGMQECVTRITETSFPTEVAQNFSRELEAWRTKVTHAFSSLREEHNEILNTLRELSEYEDNLQAFESRLSIIEEKMKQPNPNAITIAENLRLLENQFLCLTNIFNELTSADAIRSLNILNTKGGPPHGSLGDRQRNLRARYDAAIKFVSHERDQRSKGIAMWKDISSGVSACNKSLGELEEKLERLNDDLKTNGDQDVFVLKDAVQKSIRMSMDGQRILQEASDAFAVVNKRILQLQQQFPQDETLLELNELLERKSKALATKEDLETRVRRKHFLWVKLQETYKVFDHSLEQITTDMKNCYPEYPTSFRSRQIKQLSEAVESMRQKENKCIKSMENSKEAITAILDPKVVELRLLCTDLGESVLKLLESEFGRVAKLKATFDEAFSNQTSIIRGSETLALNFKKAIDILEQTNSKIGELVKCKATGSPESKLEEALSTQDWFNQNRLCMCTEVASSAQFLQNAYHPPRQPPSLLPKLPDALQACFSEAAERVERACAGIRAKVTEIHDLRDRLHQEMSDMNAEIGKISELLEHAEECDIPTELSDFQSEVSECEVRYNSAASRLKRTCTQAKKFESGEEISDLLQDASRLLNEGQSELDNLKTTVKQMTTQFDACTKSISVAREAVAHNITAIQQNVHYRLPVLTVSELEERLSLVKELINDAMAAEGSLSATSATNESSLLPALASRVQEAFQKSSNVCHSAIDDALSQLKCMLTTYFECLDKARTSLEGCIRTANKWMAESKAQIETFSKVSKELKSLDQSAPLEFDKTGTTALTSRMENLQKAKDMEFTWFTLQVHQTERLEREASATITSGFSLLCIDELSGLMEDIRKYVAQLRGDLTKATHFWEAQVSEERELRQLLLMAQAMCDRFAKELTDIDAHYQCCSAQEAQEFLSRLHSLKDQVSIGDELVSKFRSTSSLASSNVSISHFLSTWDTLSKQKLGLLLKRVEKVIEEETSKEKEVVFLQTWLTDFHRSIQQVSLDAERSHDAAELNDRLHELKMQLSRWEHEHFIPYSLRPGVEDKVELLENQRKASKVQLDKLLKLVQEKATAQKHTEERLKDLAREVDILCSEVENLYSESSQSQENSQIREICANLKKTRESLKSQFVPRIENASLKLYALDCDAAVYASLKGTLNSCRQKLEGVRRVVEDLDGELSTHLNAWEDVSSIFRQIDQWIRESEHLHPRDKQDLSELIVLSNEPFSSTETRRNMQRLDRIVECRHREYADAKKWMESSEFGRDLLKQLSNKGDTITRNKGTLDDLVKCYANKVQERTNELLAEFRSAELSLNKAKQLQTCVGKLDAIVIQCEQCSTDELLNKLVGSALEIVEAEMKPLIQDDFELQGQISRAERIIQTLRNWCREKEAHHRLVAAEKESLKVLLVNMREWFNQWSERFEEAKRTSDIELAFVLTSTGSPSKFHSFEHVMALLSQIQTKRKEMDEILNKSRAIEDNGEFIALGNDIRAKEQTANHSTSGLSERYVRVEMLRKNLHEVQEWIKAAKGRINYTKVGQSGLISTANQYNHLASEDLDTVASDLRKKLRQSLNMLQASIKISDVEGSLLHTAHDEVDKADHEVGQMLSEISQAKVTLANHSVLANGLAKLVEQSADSLAASSLRLRDLLLRCLEGGASKKDSTILAVNLSANNLTPTLNRLASELMNLDQISWLDSTDMLVQELKFVDADLKANALQFKPMLEQCSTLRNEYSDDSQASRVDQLVQQNAQLLRLCQELINSFEIVAVQYVSWRKICQNFINAVDKQSSVLSRYANYNSKFNEDGMKELNDLETDLSNSALMQQAVAEETEKLTIAVSRAVREIEMGYQQVPGIQMQHHTRFKQSSPYPWHDSIMGAIKILQELKKSVPMKIAEFERLLVQRRQLLRRQADLTDWLAIAEKEVDASIHQLSNLQSHESINQGSLEADAEWMHHIRRMQCLESELVEKKKEVKELESMYIQVPSLSEGWCQALSDATNRLSMLELHIKEHVGFLNDIQQLLESFNQTNRGLEEWISRARTVAKEAHHSGDRPSLAEGAGMLEQSRRLVHRLVAMVLSRHQNRVQSALAGSAEEMHQALGGCTSPIAAIARGAIRRFEDARNAYERLCQSTDMLRSDEHTADW
uniref:Nesprin-1 n=1 Tax=Mesocestoides corti TaxID=53468 RepID=A0A5K3ENR9_MESCO